MKRLITRLILITSLLLPISCVSTTTNSSNGQTSEALSTPPPGQVIVPGPAPAPGPAPDISGGRGNVYSVQIGLVPSKKVYVPGEAVKMALTLTNASSGNVESVYVSPLPPAVSIVIPNKNGDGEKPGTREYFEKIRGSKLIRGFRCLIIREIGRG